MGRDPRRAGSGRRGRLAPEPGGRGAEVGSQRLAATPAQILAVIPGQQQDPAAQPVLRKYDEKPAVEIAAQRVSCSRIRQANVLGLRAHDKPNEGEASPRPVHDRDDEPGEPTWVAQSATERQRACGLQQRASQAVQRFLVAHSGLPRSRNAGSGMGRIAAESFRRGGSFNREPVTCCSNISAGPSAPAEVVGTPATILRKDDLNERRRGNRDVNEHRRIRPARRPEFRYQTAGCRAL